LTRRWNWGKRLTSRPAPLQKRAEAAGQAAEANKQKADDLYQRLIDLSVSLEELEDIESAPSQAGSKQYEVSYLALKKYNPNTDSPVPSERRRERDRRQICGSILKALRLTYIFTETELQLTTPTKDLTKMNETKHSPAKYMPKAT